MPARFSRLPSRVSRLVSRPLVFALLLALALRLALWMQPLHQLANDEIEYVAVARGIRSFWRGRFGWHAAISSLLRCQLSH